MNEELKKLAEDCGIFVYKYPDLMVSCSHDQFEEFAALVAAKAVKDWCEDQDIPGEDN